MDHTAPKIALLLTVSFELPMEPRRKREKLSVAMAGAEFHEPPGLVDGEIEDDPEAEVVGNKLNAPLAHRYRIVLDDMGGTVVERTNQAALGEPGWRPHAEGDIAQPALIAMALRHLAKQAIGERRPRPWSETEQATVIDLGTFSAPHLQPRHEVNMGMFGGSPAFEEQDEQIPGLSSLTNAVHDLRDSVDAASREAMFRENNRVREEASRGQEI